MKMTSTWVVAGALALAACGSKGDGKPGADSAEAAVRGFFAAAAAGDAKRAQAFLMTEERCKVVAGEGGRKDECARVVAEERAWLSEAIGELKGAKVTNVKVQPRDERMPAFASLVMVELEIKGDSEREEVAAIQIDGRFYAAPMVSKKKADAERPGGMPTEARAAEPAEAAPAEVAPAEVAPPPPAATP